MQYSSFISRFESRSGILQLMDDLGAAMAAPGDVLMLGGGNPGHIPQVQQYFHERLQRILEEPAEFSHVIGDYDPPGGDQKFIRALAGLLRNELKWDIGPENIVLTAGSQAGFFYLFNMFGGEFSNNRKRRILFPMTPEYIGYGDVGLVDDLFVANRPEIDVLDSDTFKYRVNFKELDVTDGIGAMCISRPTNPTGNVLTDEEVRHLHSIAIDQDIPLIIDNAYGAPFPNIVYTDATPFWGENIILCLSLSKLGLPGTRCGIIIANEEIIRMITCFNAVLNLAMGSFGPALAQDIVSSGEVIQLSQQVIKPFYEDKAKKAVAAFRRHLEGIDYYIHKPEGAIFLWLWFPGLPVTSEELYTRLKKSGVLVIPGNHFFPGLQDDWQHRHECIRVTYSMHESIVEKGIERMAGVIRSVYAEHQG